MAEKHHSDSRGPSRLFRTLAGPALLALVCIGFYWKLIFTRQYTWLESPDIIYQVLPWLEYQASEWHSGRIPLWDPNLWGGQSLIGQAQPGVAYPLNWLLFALPLKEGQLRLALLHWYFVIIHFMAALFCYWLCRDLGRSRPASLFSGCAFGLGGFIGTTLWPQMINGAVWAPLVALYLFRAASGRRPASSSALAGMFLGVSWLSGHHQIPTFMTLTAAGVWLWTFFRGGWPNWRAIRPAGLFFFFALLTSGLQTVPAYEYGRLARRWVGIDAPISWSEKVPYTVHWDYSLGPTSLLGFAVPGAGRHVDVFVALSVFVLSILGIALAWKRRPVRVFAFVAAGALLFSLGRNNVFHGILYSLVPLIDKARTPAVAVFIFQFGLCVLSAYGFDYLRLKSGALWKRRAAVGLSALGVFLLLLMLGLGLTGKVPDEDRFAVTGVVALLLAAGFRAGLRRMPVLLGALLLLELGNVSALLIPQRKLYIHKSLQNKEIHRLIASESGLIRIAAETGAVPHNFGDSLGVDVFGGYVASLPSNVLRLGPADARVHELYGVTHALVAGPGGLALVPKTGVFPRAWVVHEAVEVRREAEIRSILADPGFDLRHETFLFGSPPRLERCGGNENVRIVKRSGGSVLLEANLACRGMVVLSDGYFPGWRAQVDGRPAPIYEAYTAVRGVVGDAGRHVIAMEYRPASVLTGGIMTAAGVLGALLLSLLDQRRRVWNHR